MPVTASVSRRTIEVGVGGVDTPDPCGLADRKEVPVVPYSNFGSTDDGVFWAIAVLLILVVVASAAVYMRIGA